MKKLIILIGISGSGKSTWAKNKAMSNLKYTSIISRDTIRNNLFGYDDTTISEYYARPDFNRCEKKVTQLMWKMISFYLRDGKEVIVDNTNLKLKYLKPYSGLDCPIEVQIFDIPKEICLKRIQKRVRKVPEEVIEKQSKDFEKIRNIDFKELFGEDTTIKRIYLD